jgi:hypothetical protein
VSSASHSSPARFNPTVAERVGFATALGVEYRPENDEALSAIVNRYFTTQPFEDKAPYVNDVKLILHKILSATAALGQALHPAGIQAEAGFFAHRLIAEEYRTGPVAAGQFDFVLFERTLNTFEAAVHRATTGRLMRMPEFREGDAWNSLIRDLTGFCKARSWPIGASKNDMSKQSPFVCFVQALQSTFPVDFRRHDVSYEALAAAISSARRIPRGERNSAAVAD